MTKDEAEVCAETLETISASLDRVLRELNELREQAAQARTILERMLLELEKFNRRPLI